MATTSQVYSASDHAKVLLRLFSITEIRLDVSG